MSKQHFTTTVTVDRTPAEVFAAVLNTREWWSRGIVGGTAQLGDEFVFEVPGVHRSEITLAEVVPNERVVWHVGETAMTFIAEPGEWTNTEIRFDIAERADGTELRFTHVGLVPEFECYDACSTAWTFYATESLRDLITTGVGQPSEFAGETAAKLAAAG